MSVTEVPADDESSAGTASAGRPAVRPLQAHCHAGRGSLFLREVRAAEARDELAAVDLYRTLEMTHWLAGAEASLRALD